VLTVAIMQLSNPYLVLWDAGFQLSFLATLGLVYVSPLLEKFAERITVSWLEKIIEPLTTTLAAIIATFPLILYQFGTFSFIAPLVNVLLLWLIPWLMLAGLVSVIGAVVFMPLGKLLAAVTHFGLAYVILVVRYFGELPWASASQSIPLWMMFVMYGGIIWVVTRNTKQKNKNVILSRSEGSSS
jgi:competence protein ComEC